MAGKQSTLTFDFAPTSGSTNPVTSGGVFNAINGKNLKTYYLGSQLELTGGDYKPLDIVKALPNHSIFMSAPGATYGDLASPATGANEWLYNGTVLVFKNTPARHIVLNFYGAASGPSFQKFAVSRAYISSGSSTYDAMTPWTVYDDGSNLAIVAVGTTAPQAIASGQYVVWQGSLYTAKSNIASGATLSTSNLTAVPNGGLNALNGNIAAVNDRLTISSITQNYKHIAADTWENTGVSITIPPGKIYIVSAYIAWSSGKPTGIGFSTDASSNTPSAALMTDGGNSSVQFSATYMLNSGTYYLCEKRNTANATNWIAIHYMVLN